ncbi:MAG: glycerophosphodiester phosphodiesterase family protein [Bdellovibrionota bacterium]
MSQKCLWTFLSVFFLNFNFAYSFETLPQRGILAHRGASSSFPENTVSALSAAVRLGAQGVEFDVRVSKDNQLVLMHDSSVDRTTDGEGEVKNLTLKQLKHLDAGHWKNKSFKGERVPTFAEALAVLPRTIWLNIHVKDSRAVPEIAKAISASKRQHQTLIACLEEDVEIVRQIDPTLKIINMSRKSSNLKYIEATIELGTYGIQFNSDLMAAKPNDILYAQQAGLVTFNAGTDNPKKIAQLFQQGIRFVLADNPTEALAVFNSTTNLNY